MMTGDEFLQRLDLSIRRYLTLIDFAIVVALEDRPEGLTIDHFTKRWRLPDYRIRYAMDRLIRNGFVAKVGGSSTGFNKSRDPELLNHYVLIRKLI